MENTARDFACADRLPKVPVFILNAHASVRQCLTEVLEDHGIRVVGAGGSAREAATLIPASNPDLVVLDEWLPDLTGIEACRDIESRNPAVKCLMLTSFDDDQSVLATALAGAAGYVPKQLDNQRLLAGIWHALAGDLVPDFDTKRKIVESVIETRPGPVAVAWTGQEKMILSHIAQGRTNQQISELTQFSENSIKHGVFFVLAKLGLQRNLCTAKVA